MTIKPYTPPAHRFFTCSCTCCAVSVQIDRDSSFIGCTTVDLSLWSHRDTQGRNSWRWRLKQVWRVLRWGNLSDDGVMLSFETARELAQHIIKETEGHS